jgi:hypothetical protein
MFKGENPILKLKNNFILQNKCGGIRVGIINTDLNLIKIKENIISRNNGFGFYNEMSNDLESFKKLQKMKKNFLDMVIPILRR